MTYAAFMTAALALLLAPGPTNTLMGVAGAQAGLGRVMRLLPAELLGYLTAILPLAWLGAGVLEQWPVAAILLKLAAALWVMVLAVRLWGLPGGGTEAGAVGVRRIYVTTLLNPKALIFGLILLPAPGNAQFLPKLALFCLMVAGVALIWGSAGRLTQLGDNGGRRLLVVQRLASGWLALVSVMLVAGVIRA